MSNIKNCNAVITTIPNEVKDIKASELQTFLSIIGVCNKVDFRFLTDSKMVSRMIQENAESIIFANAYNKKDVYFVNIPTNNNDYSVIYIFADKIYKDHGFNEYRYKSKIYKSIISSYYINTKYSYTLINIDNVILMDAENYTNKIFQEILNTDKMESLMKFTGEQPYSSIVQARNPHKKSGCGCFTLIIIILGILFVIGHFNGNNDEIINVHETMTSTVNQYSTFSLPPRVAAKMGDSKSKAVDIAWDNPINVDTSTVGVKSFNGTVEGYSNLVNYTVTVLPNPTITQLTNINTQNSMIKYNINFKDSIKWVWFKISKNGESENQFMPIVNGFMKGSLYLSFGSGVYQIEVLTSSDGNEPGKGDNEYYHMLNFEINNEDKRDMSYLMPNTYVESHSDEIINLANEITQGCYSDMEKTKAIHDWVATNIAYDVKALYSGDIREYSALDTLNGKQAVCNGYANLTAALNRAVGIKTKIISGTAISGITNDTNNNGHAWNETYIEDRWVIQDTTWDAGGVNEDKKFIFNLSHKYFDPDPKKFAEDHTKTIEETTTKEEVTEQEDVKSAPNEVTKAVGSLGIDYYSLTHGGFLLDGGVDINNYPPSVGSNNKDKSIGAQYYFSEYSTGDLVTQVTITLENVEDRDKALQYALNGVIEHYEYTSVKKNGDNKAWINGIGFTIEVVINQAQGYDIIVMAQ